MEKIIVRERVFIPVHSISMDDVDKFYKKKSYNDPACQGCMYVADRHSYVCDECASYLGEVCLFKEQTISGVEYVGVPVGDKRLLERRLGIDYSDFRILDKRISPKFDFPIKFTAQLRPYQEKLYDSFMKKKYGLIEAPPRTGKTITLLKIALDLGLKVLFLADQYEFITQFLDHIKGNVKEGIPKCTNLPELEKKYGKKLYGHPKTAEDFENFQIFAMPYQQYASKNGKKRFDLVRPHVGTVVVDEVHSSAAPVFARVVSSFPARYRFGVTATISRKDGKHHIIKSILGPKVASTKIETMRPLVYVHSTRVPHTGSKTWVFIMKHLCSNGPRNNMIVDQIVADLRKGRNIVVPIIFRKHALDLQRMVNQKFGSRIAELFVGGGGDKNKADRKKILQQAKAGTTRCIIGIRRLLQRGLNVPQWDTIYEILPISNKPNLKQETSRIRTPLEGKPQPIIRLFVDPNVGASVGCARSSLSHMKEFKYEFHKSALPMVTQLHNTSTGRRGPGGFEDDLPVNLLELEERGMIMEL